MADKPTITVQLIRDAGASRENMMGVYFQSDEHPDLEVLLYVGQQGAIMNRDGMQEISVAIAKFLTDCIEMKSWPDGVRPEVGETDGEQPSRQDPGSD